MIVMPVLEIWLLIVTGQMIGPGLTISLIILTGVLGFWFAKHQGLEALKSAQHKINSGQMPGEVMIDGLCILFGGILLILPGFITDIFGIILLIPLTRILMKPFIIRALRNRMTRGQFVVINRR